MESAPTIHYRIFLDSTYVFFGPVVHEKAEKCVWLLFNMLLCSMNQKIIGYSIVEGAVLYVFYEPASYWLQYCSRGGILCVLQTRLNSFYTYDPMGKNPFSGAY